MTLQEAQSIASAAFKSGVFRMAEPTTTWRDVKYNLKIESNKKRYLANREKNLSVGLTAHGESRSKLRSNYWIRIENMKRKQQ